MANLLADNSLFVACRLCLLVVFVGYLAVACLFDVNGLLAIVDTNLGAVVDYPLAGMICWLLIRWLLMLIRWKLMSIMLLFFRVIDVKLLQLCT